MTQEEHDFDIEREKVCFIISPIGEAASPTRKRADQILKHVITPCLEEAGYDEKNIIRADKISAPGDITHQIIDCIVKADLVIADLTDTNPNVFYELAIRHAIRKPYIQICDLETKLPFDIQNLRTIKFDYKDLDSVYDAKNHIKQAISSLQESPEKLMTPIHESLAIEDLLKSDRPEDQMIGSLFNAVSDLTEKFERFEKRESAKERHKEALDEILRRPVKLSDFKIKDGTKKYIDDQIAEIQVKHKLNEK